MGEEYTYLRLADERPPEAMLVDHFALHHRSQEVKG
jgi:hypothetical protein